MSETIVAAVLAGGFGGRLSPLTDVRAKPAVPFAGIYRIIDFVLSNCINSGLRQIYVLTQYKSHSLSNHLKAGWGFLSRRLDQFIDEIPAQMQLGNRWYKGTADAIRQNMTLFDDYVPDLVLVLPGDHIYKMDFRLLHRFHREKRAAITIAAARVPIEQARGKYGVMTVDEQGRLQSIEEKPDNPVPLPGSQDCLASMGIYLFDVAALRQALDNDLSDFAADVLPLLVSSGKAVYAFDYTRENRISDFEFKMQEGRRVRHLVERASDSDYWRDVGTLDAYWLANLDLVSAAPSFNLYGQIWPFFNVPVHFPPAKFVHEQPGRTGVAINSIVSDGVIISGATVRGSVLSPGIYVHSHAEIQSSVLLGGNLRGGLIAETIIGRNCRLRNAVVDREVVLGEGTVIGYDRGADQSRGFVTHDLPNSSDYIVAVPRCTKLGA